MLGILDSGVGGINTAREIRRLDTGIDLLLYLDRENAPYGEKTESELVPIVEGGIRALRGAGASGVLLACCTASSVYPHLSGEARSIAVPIIECVARDALDRSHVGIALLATDRTVSSGAFDGYLGDRLKLRIRAGELVRLIEAGATDASADENVRDTVYEMLSPIRNADIDSVILGCTHFSSLEATIREAAEQITKRKIIVANSARIAAERILLSHRGGSGQLLRL